jgi:glycosyltransferase involved in cell wall biosynthesis
VRVAQISTRFPPGPGGVERHVGELAPRLAARGHVVDVYTSDLYREFPWERLAADVPREETTSFGSVHRLPVWSLPGELHYPFFRGLGDALARGRPEIVHAHTYGTNQVAVARRHRRRAGTPFVLTAHFHPDWSIEGGWLRHRIRSFYDRRLAGPILRDAARVVVQSREEERLLRSIGVPLPPVVQIPPGYSPLPAIPPTGPSAAERFGLAGPFVLFVGRLASNKGLLELLDAFAPFAGRHPDALLVLAGEDGGMAAAVDRKAASLGIAPRVRRLGHVDDDALLGELYRTARLAVLPSSYEAFGLVLLESLAAGTPVVATRVGGIPEVIEDGRSGLLVPPGNARAVGEAMERLWTDRQLASRLGEYGRTEVVPRFTWEAVADRLDRMYREVVGG